MNTVIFCLLLSVGTVAFAKAKNPADYPLELRVTNFERKLGDSGGVSCTTRPAQVIKAYPNSPYSTTIPAQTDCAGGTQLRQVITLKINGEQDQVMCGEPRGCESLLPGQTYRARSGQRATLLVLQQNHKGKWGETKWVITKMTAVPSSEITLAPHRCVAYTADANGEPVCTQYTDTNPR